MALVQSCLCCSLITGAIVSSVYTTVVYLAAFILQLYWIIEAQVGLPAPAYIQAAAYLVIVGMSIVMIVGIIIKRCQLVLGWLFVMMLLWLPECALVILMSLHHWGLMSANGTVEISFWVCRAAINIVCIICVHSLYTTWRDEKTVMRRLHNLNMTSVLPDHPHSKDNNGNVRDFVHTKSLNASPFLGTGYRNHGYISNNEFMSGDKGKTPRPIGRSASSVSHLHFSNGSGHIIDGIFISKENLHRLEQLHEMHQIMANNQKDKSEFNPYSLSPQTPRHVYSSSFTDLNSYRPRAIAGNEDVHVPRQFTAIRGHVHPEFSTQSLDRSKYLKAGRRKKVSSMDELNIKLSTDDISLEKIQPVPFDYLNRPGSRQASEAGSEMERIKDVAL